MGNEKIKIITISAKNSETVEFRKFNSIEGNDAVYDENGSFSKQLSTNCGVFVFDINEKKNENLMVIVTPQYKVDFSNIKDNSLSTEVKKINSQKELLFFNKDKVLFFKGDEKSKIRLKLSEFSADKIKEINSLIETYNKFAKCKLTELPELNDKNKDTKITITPFAFDVAGLFEFIARERIREIIKPKQDREVLDDWEVLDGNSNSRNVLEENEKEFHIDGEVKPDIILRNKNKHIIIDAKYKSSDKNDREDRLQILAYAYLYDAHIVGHIFPSQAKSSRDNNKKELKFHELNTSLGDYCYVQLYLDDKNLSKNIKEIIKQTEEICDKENEQNGNQ